MEGNDDLKGIWQKIHSDVVAASYAVLYTLPTGSAFQRQALRRVLESSPYAKGSYSYWRVGHYTAFGGAEGERSGNCHFAVSTRRSTSRGICTVRWIWDTPQQPRSPPTSSRSKCTPFDRITAGYSRC